MWQATSWVQRAAHATLCWLPQPTAAAAAAAAVALSLALLMTDAELTAESLFETWKW